METSQDALLKADRLAVRAALAGICVVAWAYLLYMGWGMEHMDVGASMAIMPRMTSWQGIDLLLVFLMWAIMMVGMMLPSAAPMILIFVALNRRRRQERSPLYPTAAFLAGYVAVWTAFSLAAALAQWALLEARLVSPMMETTSPLLGGALLAAAGVFQFSALKQRCLSQCRSPMFFLTAHWREGVAGAWMMGLRHGLYCTGCCWLLMLLLFVLGVMNLLWIAALALFVLIEKTLPHVRWLSSASGVALIAWGVTLLLRVFV